MILFFTSICNKLLLRWSYWTVTCPLPHETRRGQYKPQKQLCRQPAAVGTNCCRVPSPASPCLVSPPGQAKHLGFHSDTNRRCLTCPECRPCQRKPRLGTGEMLKRGGWGFVKNCLFGPSWLLTCELTCVY